MVTNITAEIREEKQDDDHTPKRYRVWREKTKRHGWCWSYRVRALEADGRLRMRQAWGFATKGECEAAVARLRLDSRARQHGIEVIKPLPATTIGQPSMHTARRWRRNGGHEMASAMCAGTRGRLQRSKTGRSSQAGTSQFASSLEMTSPTTSSTMQGAG